jgi:hypothetical protein
MSNDSAETKVACGESSLTDELEIRLQPPAQMPQKAVDAIASMAATIEKPKTPDEAVWLSIYCAVANCFNSDKAAAASWADDGLLQFRKRFRL